MSTQTAFSRRKRHNHPSYEQEKMSDGSIPAFSISEWRKIEIMGMAFYELSDSFTMDFELILSFQSRL
jgi:hypothetical protein